MVNQCCTKLKSFQFCSLYGLEQLMKSQTQVACSTSSLIDHILTTFRKRDSQKGIIMWNLIVCTPLPF